MGSGPIPIFRDILKKDYGLRFFSLPMHPSKFSAIYIYDDQLGGCIAINSLHSEERRRWSLAHVYGHFLVYQYKPIVLIEDHYQRLPEREHFAAHFTLNFLMSTSGFVRRFNDFFPTNKKITPA